MKTDEEITTTVVYQSEVLLDVRTANPPLARIIKWADEHPVAWKIVTGRRSKAFGVGSCVYIGWAQQSMAPEAVLERARYFHDLVENTLPYHAPDSIFVWRARFTLERYKDKGFTGGFFQQHDSHYPRSCMTLDYTPETLELVIEKFCEWMDGYYDTVRVTVDGKTVRTFEED